MSTVKQEREAIATALQTISGLNVDGYWLDSINCPAALVKPQTKGFQEAIGDGTLRVRTYEIMILAAPTQSGATLGEQILDPYLDETGSQSIGAALDADHTLGGLVTTLLWQWQDYGSFMVGNIEYIGARFTVTVWPA